MSDTPRDLAKRLREEVKGDRRYNMVGLIALLVNKAADCIDQLAHELAAKNAALALAGSELNDLRLDAEGLRFDLGKALSERGDMEHAFRLFLRRVQAYRNPAYGDRHYFNDGRKLNEAIEEAERALKNATPQASVSARTEGDQSSPPRRGSK